MTDVPLTITLPVPAGFWQRFAAFVINIIFYIPFYALLALFIHQTGLLSLDFASPLLLLVCSVLFISSSWQATPGKRFCSVYVTQETSLMPISKWTAFCRMGAFLFPWYFFGLSMYAMRSLFPSSIHTAPHPALADLLNAPMIIAMILGLALPLYYLLLVCSVAFDSNKRSFIDKLCRTRVVRGRPVA